MRARLAPSRRLALVFVLGLGALLAAALFAESARVPLRTPLVSRAARAAPVAVPLEGREARRGTAVFRLELTGHDPTTLTSHEALQLYLEGSQSGLTLLGARLELRGTGCALVAGALDELTSREPVVFRRAEPCLAASQLTGPVSLDLVVEARGEGAVALLAFETPGAAEPAPIRVESARPHSVPLAVRGAFLDHPATAPRIALLNHMWRSAPGSGWLLGLVALALGLACAGCFVFPTRRASDGDSSRRVGAVGRGALGASLFAASLALLHAVVAPPLSGPDEPYHLLGFAALVKDEALAKDTVAWMGETHLWRIRQQPGERFRTIDVGRPYVVADDQLRPTEVAMRSAILARLWRAVAPVAQGAPAPRALLALRLVNALVFALAVGAAAALCLVLASEPYRQWLVFPFLFVPSLPFFATHVSETAVLCAVYVLLATSLALVCLDGPRAHWAGAPLGLATGLMLAGGRSPWPLVALVAAVLLGRAVLGGSGSRHPGRSALVFWGGFGLGATAFYAAMDEPYRLMTETYAVHFVLFFPAALRSVGLWLLTQPVAAAAFASAGWAVELALARPRALLATRLAAGAERVVNRSTAVTSVAVAASLLGSLILRYPQLPTEATYSMPASERVAAVLATMATMFRLTQPNFLLGSSFWVGFGWLDTIPGAALQGLVMALVGIALVALLRHVGRNGEVRRFLWLLVTAAGATAALVFYTAATQDRVSTLVGRHLVGWYLAVLAVIGGALGFDRRTSAASEEGPGGGASGGGRAAVLLTVAGPVHVYCLWFILQRYF
jgi:hypothetical protein